VAAHTMLFYLFLVWLTWIRRNLGIFDFFTLINVDCAVFLWILDRCHQSPLTDSATLVVFCGLTDPVRIRGASILILDMFMRTYGS
jgi:hypothetical protein